ncbi:MAG: EamA family transporter [Chitinophagaceae bacterium]
MFFLTGSILLTSYLTLAFTITKRLGINTFQAIVFNYLTCVITGSFFNGHFPLDAEAIRQPWFIWAVLMGAVFIATFNIVAFTAQQLGVSVASVSYKLSMVIPFVFSVWLYKEPLTILKLLGIVLALVAVYLTVRRHNKQPGKKNNKWLLALPVLLFAGSGLLDTMIKYTEQRFLNGQNNNDFLITAFASAATVGLVILLMLVITGKQILDRKAVLAGVAIGFPNYFSIWCLMVVLKKYTGNSSAIIPINNMGIVLFSAVAAWLLFKERLSWVNWLGIALSVCAIALIAFG